MQIRKAFVALSIGAFAALGVAAYAGVAAATDSAQCESSLSHCPDMPAKPVKPAKMSPCPTVEQGGTSGPQINFGGDAKAPHKKPSKARPSVACKTPPAKPSTRPVKPSVSPSKTSPTMSPTASPPPLPITGNDLPIPAIASLGLALVAIGGVLVGLRRRRDGMIE